MDGILMMFSRDLKRLPFDNIVPFNKDDVMIIASPLLAFRLTDVSDENNNYFSIGSIVESNDVFACKDFVKRCQDFSEIMEARIERYFITKKTSYLFFDEEEQGFLKGVIRRNTLTATVVIYKRDNQREQFQEVDYTDLGHKEHMDIVKYIRRLRAVVIMRPERYYNMYVSTKKESKERFESLRKRKDKDFMNEMYKKYSKLKDIKTRKQFNNYYRGLSKKYHPDMETGSHEIFSQINLDFELLRETFWFRSLEDTEKENEDYNESPKESNILTQFKEE